VHDLWSKKSARLRATWVVPGVVFLLLSGALAFLLREDLGRAFSSQWESRLIVAAEERARALQHLPDEELDQLRTLTRYLGRQQQLTRNVGGQLEGVFSWKQYRTLWLLNEKDELVLKSGEGPDDLSTIKFPPATDAGPSRVGALLMKDGYTLVLRLPITQGPHMGGTVAAALPKTFIADALMPSRTNKESTVFSLSIKTAKGWQQVFGSSHRRKPDLGLYSGFIVTRPVASFPLIVSAQVNEADALATRRNVLSAIALLVSTVIIGVGTIGYGFLREEKLLHSLTRITNEAKLGPLLAWAPDPIFFFDSKEKVLYANGQAESVFGYSQAEFASLCFHELHSEGMALQHLLGEQLPALVITSLHRKDGSECPVEIHCQNLHEHRARTLVIARDLTDRFKMQAQLENARRKASESQKMEAVGLLAGGVAHDFNNLLTVIGGYAEFLADELKDKEMILEMQLAIDRAKEMTGQLLTFSRRHPNEPVGLDLEPVFERNLSLVSRLFPEDLKLEWSHDDQSHPIYLNRVHADQLLLNLLINARDAISSQGSVRAELRHCKLLEKKTWAGGTVPPGEYTELLVEDDGCGMTKEVRSRIFQPFFTTKPAGAGTGMGLAMVFGIVQTAGGAVFIESEVGKGTQFRVLLPLYEGPLKTEPCENTDRRRTVQSEKLVRVIVVEDESSLRRLLERVLTRAGFHVESAGNGADAVEEFTNRAEEFDVLVTDVVMPGLRGPAVAKSLREKNAKLEVIYMSGYADGTLDDVDLENDTFLQKPFSPLDLVRVLKRQTNASLRDG
jgi:PAS domain S-box-containing protein